MTVSCNASHDSCSMMKKLANLVSPGFSSSNFECVRNFASASWWFVINFTILWLVSMVLAAHGSLPMSFRSKSRQYVQCMAIILCLDASHLKVSRCHTISSTVWHHLHHVFFSNIFNPQLNFICNELCILHFAVCIRAINKHRAVRRHCQVVYYWPILDAGPSVANNCRSSNGHLCLKLC